MPSCPFWLGLGALALDVFVAVAITSLVRARLGYRAWRTVHWLAYGCWALAVAHGIGIGSDRAELWMLSLDLVAVASVLGALAWRIGWAGRRPTAAGERVLEAQST
jgi:DMSO/TMAO reductase YedYZ heme-binding membrane subunit